MIKTTYPCIVEITDPEKVYVYRKRKYRSGPQLSTNIYWYVVILACDNKTMIGKLLHVHKDRLVGIPANPFQNYHGTLPIV